jgi:predicted small metal-binding protein
MMKFQCKDMGMNCDFTVTGNSKEEVLEKAKAHAGKAHSDVMKGLSREQMARMSQKLESVIKTA